MSVICCFRFLGVVDGDRCRGFGVDRSSCGELTTTPFHSFTCPPFTSWQTFTASPSLKDEGQSGSDICRPLTSTMSCRRSSQTLPSYRLLSLPTHCTGIRSIRDDQMRSETQVLARMPVAPATRPSFRFSTASRLPLPLQRRFGFSATSALAPLPLQRRCHAVLPRLDLADPKARRRSSGD